MRKINLQGKLFGQLTVLNSVSALRSGSTRWACRCSCGNITDVQSKHLKAGKIKSCGCSIPKGPTHKQWTGVGELSGDAWHNIVHNSMRRTKVPITITKDFAWNLFIKQDRKCSLSGVPLHFGTKTAYRRTASLDRIDSSKGYEEGNVQWVHKDVNRMKNIYSQDYFIETCKKIAENHREVL